MVVERWFRFILFACSLSVFSSACAKSNDAEEPELLGKVAIATGYRFADVEFGGLSGLTYDAERDIYYALSDDYSNVAPARLYLLRIDLRDGKLGPSDVSIDSLIYLRDQNGDLFAREQIDPEAIVLADSAHFLIASEGGGGFKHLPFIGRFDSHGRLKSTIGIPDKFMPTAEETGFVRNKAFESLALTPNRKHLLAANELALAQDEAAAELSDGNPVRIVRFDYPVGNAVSEHLYWTDAVPEQEAFFGLVEMVALDENRFLGLERLYVPEIGNTIRLYLCDLSDADDISGRFSLTQDVTAKTQASDKTLLIELGEGRADNVEGMTLGPRLADGRQTLVLVSDNNFNESQETQFIAYALHTALLQDQAISEVAIHAVQASGHRSPMTGRKVMVSGIVTAIDRGSRDAGFWLEAPAAGHDSDVATSEGIFVSKKDTPDDIAVGDMVQVTGTVKEALPDDERGLSLTALAAGKIEIISHGKELPAPVVLGQNGRQPPMEVIDNDGLMLFEPEEDGIDFFESVEGMRVQIDDPLVVGPTSRYGEITVVPDGGQSIAQRSSAGGMLLAREIANPQRIHIDDRLTRNPPSVATGASFKQAIVGVVDYSFGNYKVLNPDPLPEVNHAALSAERTSLRPANGRLTVASVNAENLHAEDSTEKFAGLAGLIVDNLAQPDIVALQEIQDNDGPKRSGVVTADGTIARLIAAIEHVGGPGYRSVSIDPVDGEDGGRPGANIRVAFLYNPGRVTFREKGDAGAHTPVAVESSDGTAVLAHNPGRIAPQHPAFRNSRKPLAATFEFDGERLFVINNHFVSKGGDDRLFGPVQPPRRPSEQKRVEQVRLVHDFVADLLDIDPQASVIVLGDMNEYLFRPPMQALAGKSLHNLMREIPVSERYSFVFQGEAVLLDHILVSDALKRKNPEIDIVHHNADFPEISRFSDHEGLVARFDLGQN